MKALPMNLKIGVAVTAAFILIALCAPWIAPMSPVEQDLYGGLAGPGPDHILGQDRLGRDILSRIIFGARVSLFVGLVVTAISVTVGSFIGAVSGYAGGRVDDFMMRVCDVFLAFPGILLAIAIMAVIGPSVTNVMLALCVMGWTSYARLARGQALSLKEREFIKAAEALGASPLRIIFRHILPNIAAPMTVEATFGVASAIVAEAGLSFLGLGAQPPYPSLGSMMAEGRQFVLVAPHLIMFPGAVIMLVVMGVNFFGDGIRDWLDPKR
jgi:ABC-type dipeptide/oligopeptide/nickel transport system permease subunit